MGPGSALATRRCRPSLGQRRPDADAGAAMAGQWSPRGRLDGNRRSGHGRLVFATTGPAAIRRAGAGRTWSQRWRWIGAGSQAFGSWRCRACLGTDAPAAIAHTGALAPPCVAWRVAVDVGACARGSSPLDRRLVRSQTRPLPSDLADLLQRLCGRLRDGWSASIFLPDCTPTPGVPWREGQQGLQTRFASA